MNNEHSSSRRRTLKQLAGMTALGALNALHAPNTLAAGPKPPRLSIPGVGGKIIRRQDPDYELWRQAMVWHQSKPKRYPDVIVQARNDKDVIGAVKYAAKKNLKVAVRSGGHNANGSSLRDGGMLIDVSAMSAIRIDAAKQLASVQPGTRALGLVQAAGEKGLSFPVPHCPSVGLGGFTMGGGIGWNYPQRGGVSTHSIVGAEVVTADGRLRRATPTENPDLYWAIRGSGPGFFGVVTRLDLQLYPLPTAILASSYIFPLADLETVTSTLDALRKDHNVDRVELITVLMHHPEVPEDAPPEKSKIVFFTAFAFEDTEQAAKQALLPFAQSALATKCLVKMEYQPFDFEGLYERYFSLNDPAGRCARYAVDNVLTNQGGKTLQALAAHFRNAPTKDCHVLASFNMQIAAKSDSCFSSTADCFVGFYAIWDDEKDDARNYEWIKAALPLMDPFAEGHYVNEVEGRHPDRFRQCFSEVNWNRLQALRRQYDPAGVFHHYLGQT
ncbi:MAG TPA: FAD-binding oxidoreductase [Rhodocyclaceae bacterium]|nr:FAD-binding oxidoreductase [Rhodocyclaceae bacterium]